MIRFLLLCGLILCLNAARTRASPWKRHIIDNTSQGADGVRLGDINGDGRCDIATGWEEGGEVRVYLQPEPDRLRKPWPRVTAGRVGSAEDAVFFDVNGDGVLDVVSCCEGRTRSVFAHLAPREPAALLRKEAWRTQPFEAARGKALWMFALPFEVDGKRGLDLLLGAKGKNASVGYLLAPSDRCHLEAWTYHRLIPAGWIMSLCAGDLDGDGDSDILLSDRKGPTRGVCWLENPGRSQSDAQGKWTRHTVGCSGKEVMFLGATRNSQGRITSIVATAKPFCVVRFTPGRDPRVPWRPEQIHFEPRGRTGTMKAALEADFTGDGTPEIAVSCEGAASPRSGVFLLKAPKSGTGTWRILDVSGPEGIKFDLLRAIDLDGDGDLDLLACEERELNAVLWYENPSR